MWHVHPGRVRFEYLLMIFCFPQSLQVCTVEVYTCMCLCEAKPCSLQNIFPKPQRSSCGGRREQRLKRKELPLRRHTDLRGAMETPVTGSGVGRGCGVGVPVMLTRLCLQKADNLLKVKLLRWAFLICVHTYMHTNHECICVCSLCARDCLL